MRQALHHFIQPTRGKGLVDLTPAIKRWLDGQDMAAGLLTVYCRHTSASLIIQENADPAVGRDVKRFFERIAPQSDTAYEHDQEGPDDMPAHLRAILTQPSLSIPLDKGRLPLGTWQAVTLFEHRTEPQQRALVLHLRGT